MTIARQLSNPPAAAGPTVRRLGAEVAGVDLAALPDDAAAWIEAALARHLVLVFRGQDLDPAALEALAARFGRLFVHPEVPGLPGHPAILELRKEPADETVFGGGGWHNDVTYLKPAASYSMLHARVVPEVGGDTLFASQVAAFAALSDGLEDVPRGLAAVHTYDGPGGVERDGVTAVHPVVRRRPGTDAEALYLNAMFGVRFDGMTAAESAPLIGQLTAHAVRAPSSPIATAGGPATWSCGTTAPPCTTRSTTTPANAAGRCASACSRRETGHAGVDQAASIRWRRHAGS